MFDELASVDDLRIAVPSQLQAGLQGSLRRASRIILVGLAGIESRRIPTLTSRISYNNTIYGSALRDASEFPFHHLLVCADCTLMSHALHPCIQAVELLSRPMISNIDNRLSLFDFPHMSCLFSSPAFLLHDLI